MSKEQHILEKIEAIMSQHQSDYLETRQEHISLIEETIRKTVNGKIDKLDNMLSYHITSDDEWKKELMERAEPALRTFEKSSIASNLVISFAKTTAILGGAVLTIFAIWEIWQRLTNK